MRVITGTARGRRLATLDGLDTRPTADRVKQSLFNILQQEIEGRTVLDLFAGSGQLGIEALSRGAAHCLFVDQNKDAAEIVRRNLRDTHLADKAQVLCAAADAALARTGESFDLAFLDPPYAAGMLPALLPAVCRVMKPHGVIVCETDAPTVLPECVGEWAVARHESYGRAQLWFYRLAKEATL